MISTTHSVKRKNVCILVVSVHMRMSRMLFAVSIHMRMSEMLAVSIHVRMSRIAMSIHVRMIRIIQSECQTNTENGVEYSSIALNDDSESSSIALNDDLESAVYEMMGGKILLHTVFCDF